MASSLAATWRYRGLIAEFARRELTLRYKRSVLGWLWSLITPATSLVIYTLVFGIFLRVEPPVAGNGDLKSFALFLFCGLVVWNFFNLIVTRSMLWLLDAGPLLKKVFFPPETPVLAGSAALIVQVVTELAILVLVMVLRDNISWTILLVPLVIAALLLFSIGLGLIAALLNVYFRDMQHAVPIVMTVLFFATPIVYPLDLVPDEIWGGFPIRTVIELNPLTHFVNVTRDLIYLLRLPDLQTVLTVLGSTAVSFGLGWLVFRSRAPLLSEDL